MQSIHFFTYQTFWSKTVYLQDHPKSIVNIEIACPFAPKKSPNMFGIIQDPDQGSDSNINPIMLKNSFGFLCCDLKQRVLKRKTGKVFVELSVLNGVI
jgi:hypothetical protein